MRKLHSTPTHSAPAARRAIRRILTGSIAAIAALAAQSAKAQSVHTWNGGIDLDWGNAGNWTGGVPDGNDEVNLLGAGGGILTNVYSGFTSQYRLFFNAGAGAYTLNGPSTVTFFDFGGNAPKIENNATGTTQTISFGVAMNGSGSGNAAEINPVDGNLVFGNTVDLAGTTQLRIFGNNGNTVTFNGVLSSSGNGGANTIAINENSNVVFAAANTYSGNTFVNAGKLQFAQGGSADSSTIRVGDTSGVAAAELSIIDTDGGTTSASDINVRSGSSGAKTISGTNTSGTNTFSGAVFLDADAAVTATTSGGTLAFTGSTFDLKNQTLTINGGGAISIGNALQNSSGTGNLTKSGTGTLTLSNATNSYVGATLVSNGILEVSADGALGSAAGSTTVSAGATLRLAGVNYSTAEPLSIAGVGFTGGALAATGASAYAGAITVSSNATISSTGTLNLTGGVGKNGTTATFTGGGTISINGVGISGALPNSDLVVDGATLVLNVANTYNGPTNVINGGTLQLGASNVLPTTPATDLSVTSSTFDMQAFSDQIATLTLNVGTVTGSGTLTLGGDVTSSGASSIAPAIVLGATRTFTIGAGTTTASGNIAGVGFGVTKAGTGTLALTGVNTYTGQNSVTGGTLSFNSASALGDATAATNNIALSAGGILAPSATPIVLGINRTIAVGAGGGVIDVGANTLTVDGVVSGSSALTKNGTGTLILNANNTYTGDITSNFGTVRASSANALGTAGFIEIKNTTVVGGTGNTLDLDDLVVSNVGKTLILNSTNTGNFRSALTTSGDATWSGPITLKGDGLDQFYSNTAGKTLTIGGNVTWTSPVATSTLFIRGAGLGVINGTLNLGVGALSKTDAGLWTINSAGGTWGNTGVLAGTVKLGIAGAIPSTSVVTLGQNTSAAASLDLNGSAQTIAGLASNPTVVGANTNTKTVTSAIATTLTINQAADSIYAGLITGNLTLVKQGAGVLTLANANTFAGQVTVKSGANLGLIPATVTLGTSSTLGNTGTGNETIVESGGTLNIGGSLFGNQLPAATNNEIFRIAGTGVGGAGALISTLTNGTNQLSKVVLTAAATISAGGNNQVSYGSGGNIITGNGRIDIRQSAAPTAGQAHLDLAGNTLTIAGNHLFALVNSDVSAGSFIVNAGQLDFEQGTIFNTGSGTITVNSGGRVGYWTSTANQVMSVTRPVIINGGTYGDVAATNTAFIAPSPVTITGSQNPNFVANSAALSSISGQITQSSFMGTGVDKRGTGNIGFTNITNSFSAPVNIYAGTLRGEYSTTLTGGVAPAAVTSTDTPLGTSNAITLAGGTLALRANMDNNATNQRWSLPSLVITLDRAPNGMSFDRIASAAQTDKIVVPGSIVITGRNSANGWSIGQNQFTFSQLNTHRLELGNLTMGNDTVLNVGDFIINGTVASAGRNSIQKIGGSSWGIVGAGSGQDYNAVFITGNTQTRVGSMFGTPTVSTTATLGTGPIFNGPNNAITFRSTGNIAAGQIVEIKSQLQTQSTVQFETDFTSIPTSLRAIGGGVIGVGNNAGMGAIDLGMIGDGTFRVGAGFGGQGAGTITGVMSPGAGGVVRVGAGNTVTFSAANAIGGAASLEVGSDLINAGFRTSFNGQAQSGTTILTAANNYTGGTTINRGSVLTSDIAGAVGTGPVSVFGTFNVQGALTLTADGLSNVNATSVFGGSTLNLNNGALAAGINKWGDNTALSLSNTTFTVNSANNALTTTENIGDLNISGGNVVNVNRGSAVVGNVMRLEVDNVVRQNNGTLDLIRSTGTGAGWNVGSILNVTGTAPTVTNGMVAPWIVMQNGAPAHFANYSGAGFTPVTVYDDVITTGTYVAGALTATDKVTVTTADLTLTDDPTAYALRSERTILVSGANDTITLRSGGLILSNVSDNTTITINPALVSNNGTSNQELLIYTAGGGTGRNYTAVGAITAVGLTKLGTGNLLLPTNNAATLSGQISLNGGTTQVTGPTVTGNHSPLGTGQIVLNGGQFNIRSNATTPVAFTQQNTGITLAQNIPIATVDVNRGDAASTNITMTINPAAVGGAGLVLQGSPGVQGQTFNLIGGNGYALTFGSNALNSIAGNATIHTGSANLTLNNGPTITGTNPVITKSGGNTWIVGSVAGSPSVASGTKVLLNDGTLELRSLTALGTAATTSLELNRGTLNLRRDVTGTYGNAPGYNVAVNGNSTISVDRLGANSNNLISLGVVTIKNDATLTANQGNGFGLGLAGMALNGTGFLVSNIGPGTADNGAVRVAGAVTGGSLVKLGGQHLHLLGTGTFDGGLFANAGTVRLRGAGAAGVGTVMVNPGATLDFNAANNLNVGQSVIVNSTPAAMAMISMNADVAHPTTGIDTTNAATGIVGLSNGPAGNYNTVINMSALYGGGWSLGGVSAGAYDPRYTATSLGVGAGNLYRLGGGGTSFFLGFTTAGLGQNNVLTGVGNSARFGFDSGNIYTGTSGAPTNFQFVLGGSNDYDGSTVIHRGIAVRSFAAVSGANSAFGSGAVDVFGSLLLSADGTLVNGGGTATNALTLHPGSSLVLDNNNTAQSVLVANLADRIADGQAISLSGSLIDFIGNANNPSTETLGTVTIGGSSRIRAARNGTGTTTLTITSLAGTGTAGNSLLLQTSAAAQLGLPAGDRIIASNLGTVAMVDPRVVNITDGQFVGHDPVNGFVNLTGSTNITGAAATLPAGLAASVNLNIAAAGSQTLGDNMTINSLRSDRDILNGGPFNKITLRSGGLLSATNNLTIQPDLVFHDGTNLIEARITAISALFIQGQLSANGITKAGAGQLFIRVPQPSYASGWTINSGDIIFDDPQGAGQSVAGNTITLNGSTSTGGVNAGAGFGGLLSSNLGASSRVVFRFDNQSPENITFTGGPINVWNDATVQAAYANTAGAAANDRNGTIPAISLNSSSSLSSAGLNIDVPNSRNRTVTPSLTLNADGTLRVLDGGSTGDYGRVVSFAVNSLVGTNRSLLKIGNRTLELPNDNSATFTGGSINIGQGTVLVRHDGALGSAPTAVTIERNATLEIGKANYVPANTSFTQNPGSSERWDVEDARGASYNLPAGVNLQLNTNLLTARTIGLNGGTIEGFLYSDHVVSAVLRTVDSPVTINLMANSFLGQNIYQQGATYDTGRQPTVAQPFGDTYTGASLDIRGAITGSFDLEKTGLDTVQISGTSNTYNNTTASMGVLRIGATNALPTGGALITRLGGTFDLYGFSQTVSALGTGTGYTRGGVSLGSGGRIVNSGAVDLKTLTANQVTDTAYNGSIEQNVSLTKTGAGVLTIGNPDNSYRGVTTVAGGTLAIGKIVNGSTVGNTLTSSIGQSSSAAGNLVFSGGGILRYTGAATSTDRQFTLGDAGGGFESNGSGPVTLASPAVVSHTGAAARTFVLSGTNLGANTFAGSLGNGTAASSLDKNGPGRWVLTGANAYTGVTTIGGGTLVLDATLGANRINGGNALVLSGGTLRFDNMGTVNGQTFGTTTLTAATTNVLTLGSGYTSGILVNLGTLSGTGALDVSDITTTPSWIMASGNPSLNQVLLGGTVTTNSGTNLVGTDISGNLIIANPADFVLDATLGSYSAANVRFISTGGVGYGITGTGRVGMNTVGTSSWNSALNAYASGTTILDITNGGTNAANILRLSSGALVNSAGADLTVGFTVPTGGKLTAGNGDNTAGTLTINADNAVLVNAAVVNNGTGAVSLIKTGTGTSTLSGANTYTGATTINAGTLAAGVASVANVSGAFGNNSAITFANVAAATMDITGFDTQVGSLTGGGALGGNITLGAATLSTGGDDTSPAAYAGAIAGTGGLTKIGTGTQILSGGNTFTGVTTVSNGTLQLNRATADNSAIPTDANTATTSDIVINGGTLEIAASEQIGNTGSITMSSGAFNFGSATGLTETIDKLTVSGGTFTTGDNTLEVGGATVTWSGGTNTISVGGIVRDKHWVITGGTNTVQADGLLEVKLGAPTAGLYFGGTGSPTITLDSSASLPGGQILLRQDVTVDGSLTTGTAQILNGGALANPGFVDMNGGTRIWSINEGSLSVDMLVSASIQNGALTKADIGTLQLSGANTYAGVTTFGAGVLSVGTIGDGGVTSGNLGSATNAAANLIFDGGTLQYTGATASTDRNFTINTGKVATFDITANNLTVSGASTATDGGLTKIGAGTLTLSGVNPHTGVTTIRAGTLSVGTIGNGGIAGNLGQATNAAANLIFDGGTLQYTGATASTDRNFTINDGTTGTIDVTTNNLTLSGASTTTTGALTKSGAGTLILTGANTYSGTTTISDGILQIGDGGPTGTLGSGAVVDSTTLLFKLTNTYTVPNQISGAGEVIQSGSGTTVLTATNTFTGATKITGGTLKAAGPASLGTTASVAISTGGTLLLSGTGNQVNDTAAFTMNGGTLISDVNGLSEQVGTLTLTENSVIDFGGFALGNTFRFADSAALTALWGAGKTLSIWNWTPGVDHLYVGTTSGGLTASQLGKISFYSGAPGSLSNGFPGGAFNGTPFDGLNGEVSPVPEPSSVATVMGLLGLVGWRERRKARAARAAERRALA